MFGAAGNLLVDRALDIVEKQWPDMADAHMQVPLEAYRDEELAAREREIFETSPLALIASTEIAKPHDYLVRIAVGRSILFTRDADGVAHAFLNYCRHRGAEPANGCGNARSFQCPYHAWTYDSLGHLVGMPLSDRYPDLDLSKLSLVELPSEERHGFVWVVVQPGVEIDVAEHLGDLDADLAAMGCDQMTYFNSLRQEPLASNWKSVSEGLIEALHLPYVHADTFALNPQAVNMDLGFFDAIGPHVRWVLPMFGKEDVDRIRAIPAAERNPADYIGCVWLISPGLLLATEYYGLIYADLAPGATPSEAVFRYGWLSPTLEPAAGLPLPQEMAARAARAIGQDKPVWEGCGRGLAQGAHGYALIGRNEKGVQLMHESVARLTGYKGLSYL